MLNVLLIVYDNGSYIDNFPLGTAYIAAATLNAGHRVAIYHQNVYHYPDEHLTNFLNNNSFDVVALGIIAGYYQYKKLLKISKAVNASWKRNRFTYVIGGHGPSPEPQFFLDKTGADIIVRGEGEVAFCKLLSAIESKTTPLKSVGNLAFYNSDGKYILTKKLPLIKDIDNVPFPEWDQFPIDHYSLVREFGFSKTDRVMPIVSARGCPYKCSFCYHLMLGYRPRSPESIVDEIKELQRRYRINAIEFLDELLMSSKKRTANVCEKIINSNLNIKWMCSGRLNFADLETVNLMKLAGCVFINYGIESMDDRVLERMNKRLTVSQIIRGIENTLKAGIHPGLNIIFGNPGDTSKILRRGVDFIKKYNEGTQLRTIRPVTPYPGSPLYYDAIAQGFLEGPEDFYEKKHVNSDLLSVNFTDLSDKEFHQCLKKANTELINDYYEKHHKAALEGCRKLYDEEDASFRGFRQM